MQCIRCKARKHVLEKVEQELANAIAVKEAVENRLEQMIQEKDGVEIRYNEAKVELAEMKV